jgi:hypothetical protein
MGIKLIFFDYLVRDSFIGAIRVMGYDISSHGIQEKSIG